MKHVTRILLLLLYCGQFHALPTIPPEEIEDQDNESSRKLLGQSVVTSVSVVMNGKEPQFTDASGRVVPRPMVPPQVASPINLLNPDRYEFYTFNDSGDLVKRLMTMKEIQSIVANGDGDGTMVMNSLPSTFQEDNPESKVQDIVNSVQDVLTKEMESSKNKNQTSILFDTPDVSSSWSMILPAIFGNTGDQIIPPNHKPQQVVMTPDADLYETTESTKTTIRRPVKITKKPTTVSTEGFQDIIEDESSTLVYKKVSLISSPILDDEENITLSSEFKENDLTTTVAPQTTKSTVRTTTRKFVNKPTIKKTSTTPKISSIVTTKKRRKPSTRRPSTSTTPRTTAETIPTTTTTTVYSEDYITTTPSSTLEPKTEVPTTIQSLAQIKTEIPTIYTRSPTTSQAGTTVYTTTQAKIPTKISSEAKTEPPTKMFTTTQFKSETPTRIFTTTQSKTDAPTKIFTTTQSKTETSTSIFTTTQSKTDVPTRIFTTTQSKTETPTSIFTTIQPNTESLVRISSLAQLKTESTRPSSTTSRPKSEVPTRIYTFSRPTTSQILTTQEIPLDTTIYTPLTTNSYSVPTTIYVAPSTTYSPPQTTTDVPTNDYNEKFPSTVISNEVDPTIITTGFSESQTDDLTTVNLETTTMPAETQSAINQIIESLQGLNLAGMFGGMTDLPTESETTEILTTQKMEMKPIKDGVISSSNVFKNNLLYVDEEEPIVSNLPTTTKAPDVTLQPLEQKMTTTTFPEYYTQNNGIVGMIDRIIEENKDNVQIVNVAEKPQPYVNSNNVSMEDYVSQAATVASIMSNEASSTELNTFDEEISFQTVLNQIFNEEKQHANADKFNMLESLSLKNAQSSIESEVESQEQKDDVVYQVVKVTSSVSSSSSANTKPIESTTESFKNEHTTLEEKTKETTFRPVTENEIESTKVPIAETTTFTSKLPATLLRVQAQLAEKLRLQALLTTTTVEPTLTTNIPITTTQKLEENAYSSTIPNDDYMSTIKLVQNYDTTSTSKVVQNDEITSTSRPVQSDDFTSTVKPVQYDDFTSTEKLIQNEDFTSTIKQEDSTTTDTSFLNKETVTEKIESKINDDSLEGKEDFTTTRSTQDQDSSQTEEEDDDDDDEEDVGETLASDILGVFDSINNEMPSDLEEAAKIVEADESLPIIGMNEIMKQVGGYLTDAIEEDYSSSEEKNPNQSGEVDTEEEKPQKADIITSTTSLKIDQIEENKQSEFTTPSPPTTREEPTEREPSTTELNYEESTTFDAESERTEDYTETVSTEETFESTESMEESSESNESSEPTTVIYEETTIPMIEIKAPTVSPTIKTLFEKVASGETTIHRKDDSQEYEADHKYIKLGETTHIPNLYGSSSNEKDVTVKPFDHKKYFSNMRPQNLKIQPLKGSQFHKQNLIQRVPTPTVLIDLTPIKLSQGLLKSTENLNEDVKEFTQLCNEIAFNFYKATIESEDVSRTRSIVLSPFAASSMLAMIFLGARGGTSGEMNELLRLDDMVTFNPHLIFKNITESIEHAKNSGIVTATFVRELFSDKSRGKLLQFYKEKAQQFYSGHVEEVNFNVINDIIRRRTNLLVKRHTNGKVMEYLKSNNIWLNPPLGALSANIFQTDCSAATTNERDGEMFFQVSPAVRQRRLIPIPAAVWRSGFLAGYDPEIDATTVSFGSVDNVVSTIFVMPGQQGHSIPGDSLERLENVMYNVKMSTSIWDKLLTTLVERPGLEVQIPRFSHRSSINASIGLQNLGLKELFSSEKADLRGLTGSTSTDMHFSDMMQVNMFSTCTEDKIGDSHHIEMYPSPAFKRNFNYNRLSSSSDESLVDKSRSREIEEEREYDPIFDTEYSEIPLSLRPRQARLPEAPRLKFDRPFLYFVRHNPTGMILFMGRFNPRLLP